MNIHPNAILFAELVPDDLPMKTYRGIIEDPEIVALRKYPSDPGSLDAIKTTTSAGTPGARIEVAESDYDADGYQIATSAGCILIHHFLTYGYGEVVDWEELEDRKRQLEDLAKKICERHHCRYTVKLTANYW